MAIGNMKIIRFKTALTYAIIEGTKTETRRLLGDKEFNVGDIAAIAEPYGNIYRSLEGKEQADFYHRLRLELNIDRPEDHPGWNNKLYVRPALMPHQIEFTAKRTHALHDITDEECMREGVFHDLIPCEDPKTGETGDYTWQKITFKYDRDGSKTLCVHNNVCLHPHDAFFALFDDANGKPIASSNPTVTAYQFKLIKKRCCHIIAALK